MPTVVRLSFYVGAAAFMGAVLWTIVTTKEYPPPDMEAFRKAKAEKTGLSANVREILSAIAEMPATMRGLAPVQLCTWLGLFCMWLYFPVAVAHNVFGATDTSSPQYQAGVEWGGNCFAVYSIVCFLFAFALPGMARKLGRKNTHSICLVAGAAGLMSVALIHNKYVLLLTMVGGWNRLGEHFIDALRGSCGLDSTGADRRVYGHLQLLYRDPGDPGVSFLRMDHDSPSAQQSHLRDHAGGIFMLIAALLMQRVRDPQTLSVQDV